MYISKYLVFLQLKMFFMTEKLYNLLIVQTTFPNPKHHYYAWATLLIESCKFIAPFVIKLEVNCLEFVSIFEPLHTELYN